VIDAIEGKLFTHQKIRQLSLFKEYIIFREKIASGEETKNSEIDNDFALKVKTLVDYQVSPSTTKREASTVLQW
jgi:hypothetical protein